MKHVFLKVAFVFLLSWSLVHPLGVLAQSTAEGSSAVDDLIEAFSSVEFFWEQEEIVQELIALGIPAIIPKLEKFLDHEERARRCNAALVLVGLGDERGLAILITELEDKETRPTSMTRSDGLPYPEGQIRQDRYYAAMLLGRIRSAEAVPFLIEATRDSTINYQAAISLGEIGDKSAIPALREMAVEFPEQRVWAGYGLAALGEQEGLDILAGVLDSDAHWTERRYAVNMLGRIHKPEAVSLLVDALKDGHLNVRVDAARALGEIGDWAALPALIEAMNDKELTTINESTTLETEALKAIEAIKSRGR